MEGNDANNNANSNLNAQNTTGQNNTQSVVDYNKIQEMIDSRNAKTEDSILKSYFQKQGLSEEEMKTAISSYKSQKESQANAQTQEQNQMQEKLATMTAEKNEEKIKSASFLLADELNVDVKTIPYLVTLADKSSCIDKDGKIDTEKLKTALNKVIEDVPNFKKENKGVTGVVVGADTSNQASSGNTFDFGFTGVRPKK